MCECIICGNKKKSFWKYRDYTYCSQECLKQQILQDDNTDMRIILNITKPCKVCGTNYLEKCNTCHYNKQFTKAKEKEKEKEKTVIDAIKSVIDVFD